METSSAAMTRKLIGKNVFLIFANFFHFVLSQKIFIRTDSCDHEEVDVPLFTNYLGKTHVEA